MKVRRHRINLIFHCLGLVILAAAFLSGCQSPDTKKKKQISTLRVYLEVPSSETNRTQTVSLPRSQPMKFRIENDAFVTEAMVKEAKVMNVTGGFALQIQLDLTGSLLLEEYSGEYRGRHIVIMSQFIKPGADPKQEKKLEQVERWLAAPKLTRRITDGVLSFTPDASHEEADQIVLGLNNVAMEQGNQGKQEP